MSLNKNPEKMDILVRINKSGAKVLADLADDLGVSRAALIRHALGFVLSNQKPAFVQYVEAKKEVL